jgi:hypothetical protein
MANGKAKRPTEQTEALKAEIIARIAEGEPLAQICRSTHMPSATAVNNWRGADDTFDCDFARARETGHDLIASNMRNVARGGEGSTGDVQRDKLIIETDFKLLSKWDKRYSDKVIVEGQNTVTHRYDLNSLADERLDELERILADAARGAGGTGTQEPVALH